jgi:predicted nucleotidyltransferase
VILQKSLQFVVANFETDSQVDDESSSYCPSIVVDSYHFFNVGSGVDWDEDGIRVLLITEYSVLNFRGTLVWVDLFHGYLMIYLPNELL